MSTTPAARTPLPRLSPQELTELRDRLAAEHSDLAARGVKPVSYTHLRAHET